MSKSQRLNEFNRKNIVEAAKLLFMQKGFEQTTMNDIAKEAQYSKSTIYVYFTSKNEIYYHIILEYMVLLKDAIENIVNQSTSFKQCFFDICYSLNKLNDDNPMFFNSILEEIPFESESEEESIVLGKVYEKGEEINDLICQLLKRAALENKINQNIKPFELTLTLWSCICSIICIANKKEKYIRLKTGESKEDFLRYGFEKIYQLVSNE